MTDNLFEDSTQKLQQRIYTNSQKQFPFSYQTRIFILSALIILQEYFSLMTYPGFLVQHLKTFRKQYVSFCVSSEKEKQDRKTKDYL